MYVARVNDNKGALRYFAIGGPLGWRRFSRASLNTYLIGGRCIDLVSGRTGFSSGDSVTPVSEADLARLMGTEIR